MEWSRHACSCIDLGRVTIIGEVKMMMMMMMKGQALEKFKSQKDPTDFGA